VQSARQVIAASMCWSRRLTEGNNGAIARHGVSAPREFNRLVTDLDTTFPHRHHEDVGSFEAEPRLQSGMQCLGPEVCTACRKAFCRLFAPEPFHCGARRQAPVSRCPSKPAGTPRYGELRDSVPKLKTSPGGRDSPNRLSRSPRPIGANSRSFPVRSGATPDCSSLSAMRLRKDLGKSKLRLPTTRAARKNRVCSSESSGSAQSKARNARYARSTRSGDTTVSGPA
jgi:hypothetical protein